MKPSYQDQIRSAAQQRGVDCLLHFTPLPNLASIVKHGILSREMLCAKGSFGYTSSAHRLDDNHFATSMSVSAINHGMFAAKRKASRRSDWVVLFLSPEILWTHSCRFYARNSARREMRDHRGFLGGPWAFEEMFGESTTRVGSRAEHELPSFLTTHPDAEVQVLDPISPSLILGAWVSQASRQKVVESRIACLTLKDGREREVVVDVFSPRFVLGTDAWG
ncbi:MAG: hypothetical protein GAK31_00378 [Stenotrophomonas maltophilia]|uniref:DarT domain-containing protein n=1 Tax=Stenotrophomonas maltophilia TaxID=40324 RepID=A0A7V8FJB6_STEMA|nr:MAG: hypothetical protein GAK31_00378 [Stenotrophomonas maltophilia]